MNSILEGMGLSNQDPDVMAGQIDALQWATNARTHNRLSIFQRIVNERMAEAGRDMNDADDSRTKFLVGVIAMLQVVHDNWT